MRPGVGSRGARGADRRTAEPGAADDVEPCRVRHARHRGHRRVLQRRPRHGAREHGAGRLMPSTGNRSPYFHTFFRMGDGSTVAFFESPELPPDRRRPIRPTTTSPLRHAGRHKEEVDGWRAGSCENGVEVLGPVDHKIVYSIYFHDPNGNRLEITAPVDPDWNNNGSARPRVARGVGAREGDGAPERAGHGNRPQRAHGRAEPPPRRGAADRLTRPNDMDEASIPKIISVDDHVVEPAHVWERWLPAEYRDRGPKVVRRGIARIDNDLNPGNYKEVFDDDPPTKVDCWIYEDLELTPQPHRGGWRNPGRSTRSRRHLRRHAARLLDRKARLEDMDANWTEASMCFPMFPRFCGQTFLEGEDKELLACVKAYNDWMVEEWCGEAGAASSRSRSSRCGMCRRRRGGRRNAARVCRPSASASCRPPRPATIHPGTGIRSSRPAPRPARSVNMHIGSASKMPATRSMPPSVSATLAFGNAMSILVDFLMSGARALRALKLLYAESKIGWIPYVLQRIDQVREENQGGRDQSTSRAALHLLLSKRRRVLINEADGCRPGRDRGKRHRRRPTTLTATRGGPTPSRSSASSWRACPTSTSPRSCAGNAIRLLQLDLD